MPGDYPYVFVVLNVFMLVKTFFFLYDIRLDEELGGKDSVQNESFFMVQEE